MRTTSASCPLQTPQQLTLADGTTTGTRGDAGPHGKLLPTTLALCSGCLYRPHCSVQDHCVAQSGACKAMPAAGAKPQHIPVPLSAAWRGCMSLGHLDSAKSCSAARDGEAAPRTPAMEQREGELRKSHIVFGPQLCCSSSQSSHQPTLHLHPAALEEQRAEFR